MAELAVTALGADQPGIIAEVAEVLRDRGGNVEDSAMTVLVGRFAIMLLVEIDDDPDDLDAALQDATEDFDLTISVSPAGAGADEDAADTVGQDPTHVLSVYGADKPGILAGVTRTLADARANVTDLETRLLSAGDEPVYAMVIEMAVSDADLLATALSETCTDLGVDHTLRRIETETY